MPKGLSAPIVAPTCVIYSFQHHLASGHQADNVVAVSVDSSGIISRNTILADFNSHIAGMWQDNCLQIFRTDTTFQGVHWVDVDNLSGGTGFLSPAGGHTSTGSTSVTTLPNNVAYLVHKDTVAGRGQRQGRMYFPNCREDRVDANGVVSPTDISAITGHTEAFRTAISSYQYPGDVGAFPAAMRVIHVHKPSKGDPTTWTWSSSDVTGTRCDPLAATQRRRLR